MTLVLSKHGRHTTGTPASMPNHATACSKKDATMGSMLACWLCAMWPPPSSTGWRAAGSPYQLHMVWEVSGIGCDGGGRQAGRQRHALQQRTAQPAQQRRLLLQRAGSGWGGSVVDAVLCWRQLAPPLQLFIKVLKGRQRHFKVGVLQRC